MTQLGRSGVNIAYMANIANMANMTDTAKLADMASVAKTLYNVHPVGTH